MRASMENPLVVFATTVGGFILAILLLFLMVGGGFFLALLVLALLPVALAVLAIESIFHVRPVETVEAVPASTAAPAGMGQSIALGILGALALLGVYGGFMAAVQSWSHLMGDIGQHAILLVLVLAGFGTLIGLANTFASRHSLHKSGILLAGVGTSIATGALQSCCLVPLTYWIFGVPGMLSSLAVALYINQVPVAVVGIIANVLGIAWVIALSRQTQLKIMAA